MELTKGGWRTWDSLIKGLGASVITGLILYYGNVMQTESAARSRNMERVNAAIGLTANQKDLDVNIAMRMFEKLLARYYEGISSESATIVSRDDLLLLRLIALNFQDVPINLTPMYEEFDYKLIKQKDEDGRDLLRETALEVARRQAFRMTFLQGHDLGLKKVHQGDTLEMKNIFVTAEIGEISKENVQVTLKVDEKSIGPFSVGYFDSPIIDNILIQGDLRISVLLISTDGQEAIMRLIAFQSDLATDRFDIKEMSRKLVNERS